MNQRLAVLQLEKSGYAVRAVADGRAAVAALAADPGAYALVLMDCQMPEMDGFAATREIRAAELGSGRHVPIVAMTANVMRGAVEACIAAGMDDYINKPVHYANLKQVVLRWAPASPVHSGSAGWRRRCDLGGRAQPCGRQGHLLWHNAGFPSGG